MRCAECSILCQPAACRVSYQGETFFSPDQPGSATMRLVGVGGVREVVGVPPAAVDYVYRSDIPIRLMLRLLDRRLPQRPG